MTNPVIVATFFPHKNDKISSSISRFNSNVFKVFKVCIKLSNSPLD